MNVIAWVHSWVHKHHLFHAPIQKVLSEGVLWPHFFSWWGEREFTYHYKRAIIGPAAKRHLNDEGQTLNAGLVALRLFSGSGPVLLRNPIFLCRGGGGGGGVSALRPTLWIPVIRQYWTFESILQKTYFRGIVWFEALHPSQQLWSWRTGQFTLPRFFPGQAWLSG